MKIHSGAPGSILNSQRSVWILQQHLYVPSGCLHSHTASPDECGRPPGSPQIMYFVLLCCGAVHFRKHFIRGTSASKASLPTKSPFEMQVVYY